jgi:Fe-S cluster biosynthesis and repair protein YggX
MAKDIHVDLLEIDMETGKYWLDPSEQGADMLEKIRKRNRDKWLAEQRAKAARAKASKSLDARIRRFLRS